MSKEAVDREILKPMQQLYRPPQGFDEALQKSTLLQYVDALEGFQDEDLRQAWRAVRNGHKGWGWPVPGAFVAEAGQARQLRMQASGSAKVSRRATASHFDTWKAVSRTPLALDAAARGVAWTLKCMILDGAKPETISLDRLEMEVSRAARMADRLRSDGQIYSQTLDRMVDVADTIRVQALQLYDTIRNSERETAKEINYFGAVQQPLSEEMRF